MWKSSIALPSAEIVDTSIFSNVEPSTLLDRAENGVVFVP